MKKLFLFVSILSVLCFSLPSFAVSAPNNKAFAVSKVSYSKGKEAKAVANQSVNINKANVNALTTLKGIGQRKAKAIVAYRKQHGSFRAMEDLTNVKGISQRIVDANVNRLALS